MKHHRWQDNVCVDCGIKRRRKSWKRLIAIMNHPPWEVYRSVTGWAYFNEGEDNYTFKIPSCNLIKFKKMNTERKVRIMRNALNTILLEAKEPIIKVYAQSALDETADSEDANIIPPNITCKAHNWYGLPNEKCPICESVKMSNIKTT